MSLHSSPGLPFCVAKKSAHFTTVIFFAHPTPNPTHFCRQGARQRQRARSPILDGRAARAQSSHAFGELHPIWSLGVFSTLPQVMHGHIGVFSPLPNLFSALRSICAARAAGVSRRVVVTGAHGHLPDGRVTRFE